MPNQKEGLRSANLDESKDSTYLMDELKKISAKLDSSEKKLCTKMEAMQKSFESELSDRIDGVKTSLDITIKDFGQGSHCSASSDAGTGGES